MHDRLRNLWDALRTSLWPLPVAFLGIALLLLEVASRLDAALADPVALRSWWLHGGSGDDARNLLSTLVTSLITMATLTFSITIVVLTLAAAQFGSRLVREYVGDVRTQLTLGLFAMSVLYCLLALRTVRQDLEPADVPHVTVALGLLLGLACVFALLLFLHLVARSIVADEVIRRVGKELEDAADRLLPREAAAHSAPTAATRAAPPGGRGALVRSATEGYVQSVEHDSLVEAAARREAVVVLQCRAGDFMCRGGWLARVHPAEAMDDGFAAILRDAVLIGAQRTPVQDIEFPLRNLVDVALRALSPGINDPNTAIVAIDRLRSGLARMLGRHLPDALHCDPRGAVRVIAESTTYDGLFDAAFHQIRQAGARQPAVALHLLHAFGRLAEHVRLPEQRDGLLRHAGLVLRAGLDGLHEDCDRADLEHAYAASKRKLLEVCPRPPPGTSGARS